MTDAEIIDRLRHSQYLTWADIRATKAAAADRIEALVKEKDATWNAAILAAAKTAEEGMDGHRAIAADIRALLKGDDHV